MADAYLFLMFRVFDPSGEEVVFQGALDPHTPVAQGWLHASHRWLDPARSEPYRPYHTHTEAQPLVPGEVFELDIEVWPTSIVIPAGYSYRLTVRGNDYEYNGPTTTLSNMKNPMKGCGRSFTMNRSIARRTFSAERPRCISAADGSRICYYR